MRCTAPYRWICASALLLGLGVTTSAAAQGVALVSSEKDHALTILDLKTQAVTGTIATCKRPRHMRKTADGRQLLVACGDSGQADLIDLASRKSLRRIELGDDPEIFDLSPDGRTLYVSNEEDNVVGVIDMASGQRKQEIAVGGEPEGVLVSPDGQRLYVTSEVANVVHVIDAASGRIIQDIRTGKRPRRFAISPDGAQLWVSNELDASVTLIDTRALKVLETVTFQVKGARATDITPVGLLMSKDGRRLYVGLGKANHVAFLDTATRQVTHQVLVGKRAWGLGLNASESLLLVANGMSDDLTLVDTDAARALKTVPVGRVPHSVVVVE